jgi:hypothetical protein
MKAAAHGGGDDSVDINRLSSGEKIVLGASALLVVLSFVPLWATYSFAGLASESFGAWSGAFGFFVKLALILAILALVVTGLRAAGTQLPELPVSLGLLYVGLGGLATLGLLIGVLTGPNDGGLSALAAAAGLDISRGILLFVGVILAAAIAYGGYMHMQSEGTTSALGDPSSPPPPA